MTNAPSATFPYVVDSTMVADWVACHQKFYNAHIRNLRRHTSNVHLHFGGCFAAGLRDMRRSFYDPQSPAFGRAAEALSAGAQAIIKSWNTFEPEIETPKTFDACLDALTAYVEQYPLESDVLTPLLVDGRPAVEITFALPISGTSHPETKQPILYAGRFDMLAQYRGMGVFINDEKTTTQLGASWANNWRLRRQLTGYQWGAESFGHAISGISVRGISILKHGFGHANILQHRSRFQVSRFLEQLTRDVNGMIASWREGYWDYALDTACSQFGGCPYLDLCDTDNPDAFASNYVHHRWDPLAGSGDSV